MELHSLASGSSGNAYLLRADGAAVLLESGLSASRLSTYLRDREILPGQLSGIVLTHEHSDHARGAVDLAVRFGAPLLASAGTLRAIGASRVAECFELRAGSAFAIGPFEFWPFEVPHDAAEPLGFRISAAGATVGFATDFGSVRAELFEFLCGLDALVLEANHDEEWLWAGRYPWQLKRRVASDVGHLSNRSAADLLVSLGYRLPPTVWLAHLSKHNNSPARALETVRDALVQRDRLDVDVRVASRDRPSLRWTPENNTRQLPLFAEAEPPAVARTAGSTAAALL